jgi:hypothetical protein
MMKHFIRNMSKEDKQSMMKEFMAGMSEEEKMEMMRLMMPIMMKDMKPQMMAEIMGDFNETDCKKMIMTMPPETREKCKNMMTNCLKTLKET